MRTTSPTSSHRRSSLSTTREPDTRAFAYLRISNDPGGSSISPDRQRAEIERCAQAKGFDVVEWFEDRDLSAYTRVRRPGFEALVARLDEVDAVITYELSRTARRMAEQMRFLDTLEEKGKRLISVTQGDTGEGQRFVFDVLAAADAQESRRISERVKSAKSYLVSKGQLPFRARAFGWERDGERWVQVEGEVEWLRYMVRRYLEGAGTLTIATELNDAGVCSIYGKEWSPTTVLLQLRSSRLIGFARFHGAHTTDEPIMEPVIDMSTWQRLQAEMRRRTRQHVQAPRSDTELTGLLVCVECGGRLFAQVVRRPNGETYSSYHCRKRVGHSTAIHKKFVEREVAERLFRKVEERREDLASEERSLDDEARDPDQQTHASIERIRWGLSELARDYFQERRLDRDTYYEQKHEMEERLAILEDKLVRADDERALDAHEAQLGDLRDAWKFMTHGERHQMFARLIERVEILRVPPEQRGRRLPGRIRVIWRQASP